MITILNSCNPLNSFQSIKQRLSVVWGKAFKNGPGKICGRKPLKNLK